MEATEKEKAQVHQGKTPEDIIVLRNKKKEELNQQEAAELARCLTIRERLERKLNTDVVKLELDDDLGKFTLRFRKLTPVEHEQMAKIQRDLQTNTNASDPENIKTSMNALYDLLGSASLDGLDKNYWQNGMGYSPDIFIAAMLKVMSASSLPDQKYLEDLQFFRGK